MGRVKRAEPGSWNRIPRTHSTDKDQTGVYHVYIKKGPIIPGEGIGWIRLGMGFQEVTDRIDQYSRRELANATQIICENVKIWFDRETDCISQILVSGSFEGLFDGWLGLGMTLADIAAKGYSCYEKLGVYKLGELDGICLELDGEGCDLDDDAPWDEQTVPIARISVYPSGEAEV